MEELVSNEISINCKREGAPDSDIAQTLSCMIDFQVTQDGGLEGLDFLPYLTSQ